MKIGDAVIINGYDSASKNVDGLAGVVLRFSSDGCVVIQTPKWNACVKISQVESLWIARIKRKFQYIRHQIQQLPKRVHGYLSCPLYGSTVLFMVTVMSSVL